MMMFFCTSSTVCSIDDFNGELWLISKNDKDIENGEFKVDGSVGSRVYDKPRKGTPYAEFGVESNDILLFNCKSVELTIFSLGLAFVFFLSQVFKENKGKFP